MQKYLVFDVGGTFIKYAMMDSNYTILERGKVPTPLDSMDSFFSSLQGVAARYAYSGIAMSLPGCIDTANGFAHTGGALPYIKNLPLAAQLESVFHVPVTIANDAHCAANAEVWDGALAGVDSGCVMVLGTGIGGGIVLNGKVLVGRTFSAGQFSALPTDFEGIYQGIQAPDSPGFYSFWTGLASASGLLHTYAHRRGIPAEGLDGMQFFAAYDAGEPEAAETLNIFGRQAAAGIYAVQTVLDVQRFAIGGGISARPEVTDVIRESLDQLFRLVPVMPVACPEIVPCRYGNDANLIGALRFYLDQKQQEGHI